MERGEGSDGVGGGAEQAGGEDSAEKAFDGFAGAEVGSDFVAAE